MPEAQVRAWLGKAVNAPRGTRWVCDNCSQVHKDWMPICSNCGAFDTLSWREAPDDAVAGATGTDMLPLIVGDDAAPVPAPIEPVEEMKAEEPEVTPPSPDIVTPSDPTPGEEARK